jgi:rhodanese-related sulfurtransferase
MVKEVTVQEVKKMLDEKQDFQLIDVREQFEYDTANIGAELIPLGNILLEADKISKDKMVVVHCRSGARSAAAIMQLEQNFGFTNLYNMKGGIIAWANEIDASKSL